MSSHDQLHQLESRSGLVPRTDLMLKLLIVKGSLQNSEAIAKILQDAGYTFTWEQVTNKTDYYACLDRDGYDLIIADYHLAGFGNRGVLQLLQEQALHIPVIVINGVADTAIAVECIKAGAADYLLSLEPLATAVEQALVAKTRFQQHQTQTEGQLKTLISANADGIIVVNRHRTIQFINPAARALLGRQAQELLGQKLGFPVASDYLEVDLPSRHGDYHVAQMRVVETQWHGDMAYLISLRDITQLKRIEAEREQLLEEAEAANRAKDEFLAILSHELRTPLNPILGWTKLLQKGTLNEEKTAIALETIERNANLQVQLIEDLLDISRIIRGNLKLEARPTNLALAIVNALDTVRLAAQSKSIQLESDLEADVSAVYGDPTRLQQIVWNLVSNAIKFTPDGGRVMVKLFSQDGKAQVQVSDTGKGIDPEFLPHVFDYFRQADSTTTRASGGLGLGLAIVRRLAELHGGTVSAHSSGIGQGSTFTVSLPRLKPKTAPQQSDSTEAERSLEGARILIIEDEADVRELLVFVIENEGAQVVAVASASKALEEIVKFKPEILVSDIAMTEIDGYALIRTVRDLPPELGGGIPALALSAYVSESDRQRSLQAGFNEHLDKPVDMDDLIETLARLRSDV